MAQAGAASTREYLARLAAEPGLLDALVAEITIGESYFFRDPDQLTQVVEGVLVPLASHQERLIRVWSAGCASGEEPYSLAIALERLGLLARVHILGTDLSRAALARARSGRYTRWSLRGVAAELVKEYFRRAGDGYDLRADIREAVEFRYLNLAQDAYPSLAAGAWGMDAILCRNVLIYLDAETITRVVGRLVRSLGDQGWLVLGAADPLVIERTPCEAALTTAGLLYRRAGTNAPLPQGWRSATGQWSDPPVELARPVAESPAPVWFAAAPRESIAPAGPQDPEAAAIVRVRALANAGRLAEAGHACATAVDRHRLSPELLYLHAVLLMEGGSVREAITAARRALYLDRGLVVGQLILGAALARAGETDNARRAFRHAERLAASMQPDALVPASDGEPAGRLLEMVRAELGLLGETAA